MGTSSTSNPNAAPFSSAIPARLDAIAPLTEALAEWAAAAGVAPRVMAGMTLILDELITNVVTHGLRDAPGDVQLRAELDTDCLVVTLRDQAPAFNPLDAPEPDTSLELEDREVGGLGVHLVRKLADGLHYRRTEDRGGTNELRIVKRLAPPPEPRTERTA